MSEHDSTISVEEYLEYLCEDAGVGLEAITDRDIGAAVLAPNFASQLVAIRSVLQRNQEAEEKVLAEIVNLKAEIRGRTGTPWMEYDLADSRHHLMFLDAAHSMAAVGLIAPLFESLFDRAFRYLRCKTRGSHLMERGHERWQLDNRWDHRYEWRGSRRRRDIVKGIVQLAEAIGLVRHLPDDLETTLSVLFAYRNKMFHCGLEWRDKDLRDFANNINSKKRADCFNKAESDGKPWIFYMSREFTDDCLDSVDSVIEGIGAFVRPRLWPEGPPNMGW